MSQVARLVLLSWIRLIASAEPQVHMGCTTSTPRRALPRSEDASYHSRETRILQDEMVDSCEENGSFQPIRTLAMDVLPILPYSVQKKGIWERGISDGGSRNDLELFSRNPQYLLSLGTRNNLESNFICDQYSLPPDMNTFLRTCTPAVTSCHIILEQVDTNLDHLHIAFFVYKTDTPKEALPPEYFLCVSPVASTGSFVNRIKIEGRYELELGMYIVIPATYLPFYTGHFTLTVSAAQPLALTSV